MSFFGKRARNVVVFEALVVAGEWKQVEANGVQCIAACVGVRSCSCCEKLCLSKCWCAIQHCDCWQGRERTKAVYEARQLLLKDEEFKKLEHFNELKERCMMNDILDSIYSMQYQKEIKAEIDYRRFTINLRGTQDIQYDVTIQGPTSQELKDRFMIMRVSDVYSYVLLDVEEREQNLSKWQYDVCETNDVYKSILVNVLANKDVKEYTMDKHRKPYSLTKKEMWQSEYRASKNKTGLVVKNEIFAKKEIEKRCKAMCIRQYVIELKKQEELEKQQV